MARPLTGFGHGAAGLAYALLRLGEASGELSFRHAAEEAIAFETAVYADDAHNWPDYRYQEATDRYMVAWCNGATGIGLGRLGGLNVFNNSAIRRDLDNADHICCGNLGRIELLIEAAWSFVRADLWDAARKAASMLVRRAKLRGRYGLHAQASGATDSFSLFQGTAGIGYELLRLADPGNVPSVLLWR
jgi:lantibiotic modifying enzyme